MWRGTIALAGVAAFVGAIVASVPRAAEFGPGQVGEPRSGAPVEIYRPAGAGPFPAVVVLHPCNGVARSTRAWAERLRSWGYVAAVVDSFGPRGMTNVCGHGLSVPPATRGADAFAGARILAARPDVRPDRIGVLGMSHGAGGVLAAAETGAGAPIFRAAVAFYPWCPWRTMQVQTETLILIGDADDWTPAPRCSAFVGHEEAAGQPVSLKVYPGALHAFDNGNPVTTYFGHRVGGDPAAAADAIERTRTFLAAHLRG